MLPEMELKFKHSFDEGQLVIFNNHYDQRIGIIKSRARYNEELYMVDFGGENPECVHSQLLFAVGNEENLEVEINAKVRPEKNRK